LQLGQNNLVPAATILPVLPPGLPAWISAEAIADTLRTFQPYYEQTLTVDDAIEMLMAAGNLFDVLKDDSNAEDKGKANQGKPKNSEPEPSPEAVCCPRPCEQS